MYITHCLHKPEVLQMCELQSGTALIIQKQQRMFQNIGGCGCRPLCPWHVHVTKIFCYVLKAQLLGDLAIIVTST